MNLRNVLESLDPETVLQDGDQRLTASRLLDAIDGSSDLAEPATRQGDEIYLTDENGNIYTAADPAYTIVK